MSVAVRCAGFGIEKTSSALATISSAADAVGGLGRQSVEQAAGHRADDGRRLPGRRIPGDRVGEVLRRHEIGDKRGRRPGRRRRAPRRTRRARRRSGPTPVSPRKREQQQRQRADRLERRGKPHDQPPAEAVGDRARDQDQQQRRQELNDPDQAEIEGIARQIVDLPADRDGNDLGREGRQEPRYPEAEEGAMPKGGILLAGGRGLGWHRLGTWRKDGRGHVL